MAKVATKKATKKRVKKNVGHGQAHIQSSFNNTIVTLTDSEGNAISAFPCRHDPAAVLFSKTGLTRISYSLSSVFHTDISLHSFSEYVNRISVNVKAIPHNWTRAICE